MLGVVAFLTLAGTVATVIHDHRKENIMPLKGFLRKIETFKVIVNEELQYCIIL